MTFEPEQKFAHFKVIRKLGEGGMGVVYLAEDQKLGRPVALKILQSDFFEDKDKLDRFYREARTAARISHPNVMGIHDIGSAPVEEGGQELSYIVMEYIEGMSLKDYLSKPGITMADLLRVEEKVARGLAEAHKLSIVHRDIKADNIIINADGEPKILDFGLAKPVAAPMKETGESTATISQELTQEGKIVGTVTYMSPEQARGGQVDSRSDIFSFGVVMYKMFTGQYPFEGPDRVSTIAKILESPHEPIRRKEKTLPSELERIVDKCLQKDPDYRYQDTRDLVVDLRSLRRQYESGITDTDSMIADRIGSGTSQVKSNGSVKKIIAAASIVVVAAVIIVAIALRDNGSLTGSGVLHARQNALAILGFENKTGDQELDWLQAGLPEILLTDLAQNGASNIISRNRVLDCLERDVNEIADVHLHQECVNAAKSLGATKVLSGSFFKLGDKIRIDARLEDIETGQIIMGEKVIGDDPFALVDSLTTKIASSLNIKMIAGEEMDIASLTSSSPEAYKQYILGMEKFSLTDYDESLEYFKKAVALDSTFALPYLRMGIAYFFKSQMGEGIPYLQMAEKYSDRLPRKDRELLDMYNDVFLRGKFNEAFIKMENYVRNYPDDKEPRSIYAELLYQVSDDPGEAKAHLDTILMIDPRFLPALRNYIAILSDQEQFDSAIIIAERVRDFYPDNHVGYVSLVRLYSDVGKIDKALSVGREYLEKDPKNATMLELMSKGHLYKREFDQSRMYAEGLRRFYKDEPYTLLDYYRLIYNIENWQGAFKKAIASRHDEIEMAISTGDSALIFNAYNGLANFFEAIDFPDSAIYYAEKMVPYAVRFQHFNYPLHVITSDYSRREEAREYFDETLERFKASVPSEVWRMGEVIQDVFMGLYNADTVQIVEAFKELSKMPYQDGSSNNMAIGQYSALIGNYGEAIEALEKVTSGAERTISGITYLRAKYYLGLAYQGMGQTDRAIESFEEILNYWGEPEIELEMIADTRKRLAELQS